MSHTDLTEGMEFDSIKEGRIAAKTWLVRNGWSSKVARSGPGRTIHQCISKNCPFTLNINKSLKGIRLTKLRYHTCPVSTHNIWRGRNNNAVLSSDPLNIGLFVDNPKTKSGQLRNQELRLNDNSISRMAAWRARESITDQLLGNEEKSFRQIPGLLLVMRQGQETERRRNTQLFCEYELNTYGGQFIRCWVLPRATQKAFRHCRKLVAIDGTWTKGKYILTLLVITTVDGNGNTLPLAWALVNQENDENWSWFLSGVTPYLPGLMELHAIMISDRQKGLTTAVARVLPNTIHGHCCQHIADNISQHFSTKTVCVKLFWRAARAKTKPVFDTIMTRLAEEHLECAAYLKDIEVKSWARHAFPVRRWLHDISNISELMNNTWLKARELPAFNLLLSMWN